jgi:hypothetical protein
MKKAPRTQYSIQVWFSSVPIYVATARCHALMWTNQPTETAESTELHYASQFPARQLVWLDFTTKRYWSRIATGRRFWEFIQPWALPGGIGLCRQLFSAHRANTSANYWPVGPTRIVGIIEVPGHCPRCYTQIGGVFGVYRKAVTQVSPGLPHERLPWEKV